MPIRPENKARYPKNWYEISQRIRYERARNRCEKCGVKNHALGGRTCEGIFLPANPTGDDGLRLTWPKPGEYAWCGHGKQVEKLRIIKIILTVAHLDHQPENCADENLMALCQRCHNLYDASMRRKGVIDRQFAKAAIRDLFQNA